MKHPQNRTYVLMALPRRLDEYQQAVPTPDLSALPLFIGGGGDNLLCGECLFMLAQSVELENLRERKLICPRCERENVIPVVGELRALGQEAYSPPAELSERPANIPDTEELEGRRVGTGSNPVEQS